MQIVPASQATQVTTENWGMRGSIPIGSIGELGDPQSQLVNWGIANCGIKIGELGYLQPQPTKQHCIREPALLAGGQASDGARSAVARFGAALVDAALAASPLRTSRPHPPVLPAQPSACPEPKAAAVRATGQLPAVLNAVDRTSAASASQQLTPGCTEDARLLLPHHPTTGYASAVAPRQHPPTATATPIAVAQPSPAHLSATITAATAEARPPQSHCAAAPRPESPQPPRSVPAAVRSSPTMPAPPTAAGATPTRPLVQLQAQTQQLGPMEVQEQWALMQRQRNEQRQLLQLQWQAQQRLLLRQHQRRGALSGACDLAHSTTIPAAPAAAAPTPLATPEAVQVGTAVVSGVSRVVRIPKRIRIVPPSHAAKARRETASACAEGHARSLAPTASPQSVVPASGGSAAASSPRMASAIAPPTSAPAMLQLSPQSGDFPPEPKYATPPISAPALVQLQPVAIPTEPKSITPLVVVVGDAAVADEDVALGPPRPETPDQAGAQAPSMAPAGEDRARAHEDGATTPSTLARTPTEGQPCSPTAPRGAAGGIAAALSAGGFDKNQRPLPRTHPMCTSWIPKTHAWQQPLLQQQQLGDSEFNAVPLPQRQMAYDMLQVQDATTAVAATINMPAARPDASPHAPADAEASEALLPAPAGVTGQQRLYRLQQPTRRQVRSHAVLEAGALRALRNLQPRWPLARSGQPNQVLFARALPHLRNSTAASNAAC